VGLETLLEVTAEGPRVARWGTLSLSIDLESAPSGARAFVALGADDVIVSKTAPRTSARHSWPATVEEVRSAGDDRFVTLRPEGGGGTLLARISGASAEELSVAPGAIRSVLFKSSSLRRLGNGDRVAR
jgi:molybdopterin-binding protein